jgi:hypothetical protein
MTAHDTEARREAADDIAATIVIDTTWTVTPAPTVCAYSIACDQPAAYMWNVTVPGPVQVCEKDRAMLIGWNTPEAEFIPLAGLNGAVRYWDVNPGMWIKPVGGTGSFRKVDEIEHIGARVIIGYTDDAVECGRYPDTQWFLVRR